MNKQLVHCLPQNQFPQKPKSSAIKFFLLKHGCACVAFLLGLIYPVQALALCSYAQISD
jgi:hypothetical protein